MLLLLLLNLPVLLLVVLHLPLLMPPLLHPPQPSQIPASAHAAGTLTAAGWGTVIATTCRQQQTHAGGRETGRKENRGASRKSACPVPDSGQARSMWHTGCSSMGYWERVDVNANQLTAGWGAYIHLFLNIQINKLWPSHAVP